MKDVEDQVEEAFYMSRMEPAIRAYLTTMREEAYIEVAPGYTDTGASPKQIKPVYSAYVPPSGKKKKKVERTRYRETTHTFRQKGPQAAPPAEAAAPAPKGKKGKVQPVNLASMKPGKKEKIRYGKAPQETLPSAAKSQYRGCRRGANSRQYNARASQSAGTNQADAKDPLQRAPQSGQARQERARRPKDGPKCSRRRPMLPRWLTAKPNPLLWAWAAIPRPKKKSKAYHRRSKDPSG